ncbi:MAG: hypothetical protein U0V73_08540 [Acidimicrobiia bacterium]
MGSLAARRVALAAVVLALGGCAGDCTTTAPTGAGGRCTVTAHDSHVQTGGTRTITGLGSVKCDHISDLLSVRANVEYETFWEWVTLDSRLGQAANTDYVERLAFFPCQGSSAHNFETYASAIDTYQGVAHYSEKAEGNIMLDLPCDPAPH